MSASLDASRARCRRHKPGFAHEDQAMEKDKIMAELEIIGAGISNYVRSAACCASRRALPTAIGKRVRTRPRKSGPSTPTASFR